MSCAVTVIDGPAEEPVSLALAKTHLRIDHPDEDDLIRAWVRAARRYAEEYCGVRFVTQTLRVTFSAWPSAGAFALPVEPVESVESVEYLTGGVWTEIDPADYVTGLAYSPPVIAPVTAWPDPDADVLEAIRITVVAGAPGESVPDTLAGAVLLTVGYWDENRGTAADEMGLPPGAKRLLDVMSVGHYLG